MVNFGEESSSLELWRRKNLFDGVIDVFKAGTALPNHVKHVTQGFTNIIGSLVVETCKSSVTEPVLIASAVRCDPEEHELVKDAITNVIPWLLRHKKTRFDLVTDVTSLEPGHIAQEAVLLPEQYTVLIERLEPTIGGEPAIASVIVSDQSIVDW